MKGASLADRRWLCGSKFAPRSRCRPQSRVCVQPHAKVTLVRPVAVEKPDHKPLLVYLPGTDGTGNSITPQLPGLLGAGFDVRSLYISRDDRSGWDSLTQQIVPLIRDAITANGSQQQVTLVAESFGGCLAFRLALAAPELIANMIVVNSATCFDKSYNGIVNLIAATKLLTLFPEQLYQVAQAVLVPLLVNKEKIGPSSLKAIKSMMVMDPPLNFEAGTKVQAAEQSATTAATNTNGFALYEPSGTASWRMNMMTHGNLPDSAFKQISTRTLLVGSGRDRLLPSLTEQARLQRLLPNSQRLLLPESGHTALLEADVDLVSIMARTGFLPEQPISAGATALVSQGSQEAASVTSSNQCAALRSVANGNSQQPRTASSGNVDSRQSRPLAEALPLNAKAATQVNSSQASPEHPSGSGQLGPSAGSQQNETGRMSQLPFQNGDRTNSRRSQPSTARLASSSTSPSQQASTADIVEGWVGDNLNSFVNKTGEVLPSITLDGVSSRSNGSATASRSADGRRQQLLQQQAQASQSEASNGQKRNRLIGQQNGAEQQRQGVGQGQYRPRGGSWATVDDEMEKARQFLSPWRSLIAPVVKGTEHLPDPLGPPRPLLFVGNHTVIGLYDLPLLVYELYVRGYKVRGLAHPGHWKTPLGPLFESMGAVMASPMAAYRLLHASEAVLLFPGGSREVNKRKGEKYKLIWKDKAEFVRLAAKTNALIIPFAAVGGEEAFDIALDSDEVLANPVLGPLAQGISTRVFKGSPLEHSQDAIGPITKLPGTNIPSLVPLPKLERLYFRFMPAVDATAELPDRNNTAAAETLYNRIKQTVEQGMEEAQQDRQADPERDLGKRLVGQVQRVMPSWELLNN